MSHSGEAKENHKSHNINKSKTKKNKSKAKQAYAKKSHTQNEPQNGKPNIIIISGSSGTNITSKSISNNDSHKNIVNEKSAQKDKASFITPRVKFL